MTFDEENSPTIQCWSVADAPLAIRQALPTSAAIEWIAQIPAQLQSEEVVALLTQGPGIREILCEGYLLDGSYVIAGSFAHRSDQPPSNTGPSPEVRRQVETR